MRLAADGSVHIPEAAHARDLICDAPGPPVRLVGADEQERRLDIVEQIAPAEGLPLGEPGAFLGEAADEQHDHHQSAHGPNAEAGVEVGLAVEPGRRFSTDGRTRKPGGAHDRSAVISGLEGTAAPAERSARRMAINVPARGVRRPSS